MKKVIYRLQSYYDNQATEVEKPIIRYILDNPRDAVATDIHSLAKQGYCSAATIVRICKKNGFKGLRELKIALMEDINFNAELIREKNTTMAIREDKKNLIREIFEKNIMAITNTFNLVDFGVTSNVVKLMKEAKVIRLYAIGASYLVAKDLQHKLERINKTTTLYEDTHMQIVSSNNATEEDIAIIISYSGQTREILDMAKTVKSNGCKIVSITQYSNNKLMSIADFNLFVPSIEEAPRVGAGTSRLCQLSVVDYLYHSYLEIENKKYMERIIRTNDLLKKN